MFEFILVVLSSILFILNFMKMTANEVQDNKNEVVVQKIKFILETNSVMRNTLGSHMNARNHHIAENEFPIVRDIIFRCYNPYVLHDIDRQQYLLRTLSRRDNRTIDYFTAWFKNFLCESNPDWMNYEALLQRWTSCFAHDENLLTAIIKQVDRLYEQWSGAALADYQRSVFFATHMATLCFGHGTSNF